jgi:hypothetical protein
MRTRLERLGLLYLAVGAASVGAWALPAPRSWFDRFPGGPSDPWAAALPPYNEHLTRDVGALYLGFAVLFVWAAWRPVAALVVPVAVAWIVVQVPHLVFHFGHDERLSTGNYWAQAGALAGFVVVALAVALSSRQAVRGSGASASMP